MLRIKDGDEHRPKRSADVSDRARRLPCGGPCWAKPRQADLVGVRMPSGPIYGPVNAKKKKDPPVANLPFFRSCMGFNKDLRDSFLCN